MAYSYNVIGEVCLSVPLSVCQTIFCLSSVCPSIRPFVCLSVYLSVYRSVGRSVSQSVIMFVCLPASGFLSAYINFVISVILVKSVLSLARLSCKSIHVEINLSVCLFQCQSFRKLRAQFTMWLETSFALKVTCFFLDTMSCLTRGASTKNSRIHGTVLPTCPPAENPIKLATIIP